MTKLTREIISKTMKAFSIDKSLKSDRGGLVHGRLGQLKFGLGGCEDDDEDESKKEVTFKTPMYFVHTQTGSVTHVSGEVLEMIYAPTTSKSSSKNYAGTIPPLQISIDSTIRLFKLMETTGKGINTIVGLPGAPTFLTIHELLYPLRGDHNDKSGIALWTRHGRTTLTPGDFTKTLKKFKSDFSQIISDYDVNPKTAGMKRFKKSLSRAEEYTQNAVNDKPLHETGLFITLEASWFQMDEELARKSVATLLESQDEIEGAVLAGLNDRYLKRKAEAETSKSKTEDSKSTNTEVTKKHLEKERLDISTELDLELVSKMVEVLPPSLPKYLPGPWRLTHMVDLISRGVDIFDTSVASRMADNAEVFILDGVEQILPSISKSVPALSPNSETLPVRNESSDSNDTKNGTNTDASKTETVELPLISLEDKRFFGDFAPISKTCSCLTCRKHTRSYVHHLYATDELLGPVLVQIHNLTTFERFFKIIRGVIEDSESPEEVKTKFQKVKEALTVSSCANANDADQNTKVTTEPDTSASDAKVKVSAS